MTDMDKVPILGKCLVGKSPTIHAYTSCTMNLSVAERNSRKKCMDFKGTVHEFSKIPIELLETLVLGNEQTRMFKCFVKDYANAWISDY